MAIVYSIQPNPHWVIIDNFSRLPAGAAIYTYRSLDPDVFKPAFEDAAGTVPYGQPIVGFGNGTMPPIFWEFDDANPDELYYIRVYDSANPATQNFLWDFDGISGAGTGGGGGITVNNNTKNLLANNIFYRNIGAQVGAPSVPTFITLSPANNAGYVGNTSDPLGPAAPDNIFAKANTSATDSITFPAFTPLGVSALGTSPTPTNYVNYTCSIAGSGETYKYFQFPIVQGLQALSGQTISIKIYSRWNSGENGVIAQLRQFFGNGGSPSADVTTVLGSLSYPDNNWNEFQFTSVVVPSIAGKTLGTCGNDGLFLQILMPVSGTGITNIDLIKPAIYLGTNATVQDFNNYDQIDSIISLPRTGDTRTSLNSFSPYGWVTMNDGTIGNASSNASTRANIDTFPLFDLIWNKFQASQATAPMYTSAGAPVAYGASSFIDFDANRQISLTRNLGRVMAGALPVAASQSFTRAANTITMTSTAAFYTGMAVTVSGGSLPTPLVAGTIYYAVVVNSTTMSLATTTANALAGTVITLTAAGTGTIVSLNVETLGSYLGEEAHAILAPELPSLDDGTISSQTFNLTPGGTPVVGLAGIGGTPANVRFGLGTNVPHNTLQPTVYMNIFVKL